MSELAKLVGVTLFGSAALFAMVSQRDWRRPVADLQQTASFTRAAATNPSSAPADNVAILYADARGHFLADVQVRGTPIRMLVDTGASLVSFSAEDAAKFGLRAEPGQRKEEFATANGIVKGSIVRVPEMRMHGIVVYDIEAAIMPPGALKGTLLGMSFLQKLQSYEVRGASMVLRK